MTESEIGFKTEIQEKDEIILKQAQLIQELKAKVLELESKSNQHKRSNITIENDEPESTYENTNL